MYLKDKLLKRNRGNLNSPNMINTAKRTFIFRNYILAPKIIPFIKKQCRRKPENCAIVICENDNIISERQITQSILKVTMKKI